MRLKTALKRLAVIFNAHIVVKDGTIAFVSRQTQDNATTSQRQPVESDWVTRRTFRRGWPLTYYESVEWDWEIINQGKIGTGAVIVNIMLNGVAVLIFALCFELVLRRCFRVTSNEPTGSIGGIGG